MARVCTVSTGKATVVSAAPLVLEKSNDINDIHWMSRTVRPGRFGTKGNQMHRSGTKITGKSQDTFSARSRCVSPIRPPLSLLPCIYVQSFGFMKIDSFWRSRTIAEAQGQGYTHLRATCPKCGRIADVPWPLLIGRKGTNRNTFLRNIPLRCQRCGNSSPVIGVRHHNSG